MEVFSAGENICQFVTQPLLTFNIQTKLYMFTAGFAYLNHINS